MSPAIKCLILLAVVALFFVTELIPLAITAMGGAIACGLLGFIPAKQVFSGLSNSTVVLFGGMFVVGASMFYTGLAQKIGNTVVSLCGTGVFQRESGGSGGEVVVLKESDPRPLGVDSGKDDLVSGAFDFEGTGVLGVVDVFCGDLFAFDKDVSGEVLFSSPRHIAAQNSLKRVLFNAGEFDFDPVEVNGVFYGVLHAEVDVAGYVLRNAQPGVTELVELSDLFGVEVDFSLFFDHSLFVSFDSEVFQNVTAFDVDDGSHLFCRKADRCEQNCDKY